MPLASRRIFRLSLTVALSLAGAYALQLPLPYFAPLVALMLTADPSPPMGLKSLVGLILVVIITTGMGLLLIPLLINYPALAILTVTFGLFLSNYLSVNKGKVLVGSLITVGLTLISAAGTVSFSVALTVVRALVFDIGLAVVCQWLVYPWFPEDALSDRPAKSPAPDNRQSNWIAMRATLITIPSYLLALTNPLVYLSVIMKSVTLGQQGSVMSARNAGRELLGSTFLAGCFAILFWFALDLFTNLWMFSLWMMLFGIYFSSKLYRLIPSCLPPSFWTNVFVTMLILLGPTVEDSANGKDVYKAFAVRMGLFIAVTLYAWAAIFVLDHLRTRRYNRTSKPLPDEELIPCS